jgi:hypothetical protein
MNDINALVCEAARKAVKQLGGKPRWVPRYDPYNVNGGEWVL